MAQLYTPADLVTAFAYGVFAANVVMLVFMMLPSRQDRRLSRAARRARRHNQPVALARARQAWLWTEPVLSYRTSDHRRTQAVAEAWEEIARYRRRPYVRLLRSLHRFRRGYAA